MDKQGTLFGVGLGPGDPDLVTIKAAQCLARVRVVAYPMALGKTSFARRIAACYLMTEIKEIVVDLITQDGTKTGVTAKHAYDTATQTITEVLQNGQDVAFLCAGDPFLYGSFMYVHDRLHRAFKVSVIPGVSSITAAAADAHVALARHHESLHILPATLDETDLARRLQNSDNSVVLKAGPHMSKIKRVLQTLPADYKAVYVAGASWRDAVVCPVSKAPEVAPYFSLVIITKITSNPVA